MLAWKIYGLTVVALFLNMFAVVLVQGKSRFQSNTFANPEDATVFGKEGASVAEDDPRP